MSVYSSDRRRRTFSLCIYSPPSRKSSLSRFLREDRAPSAFLFTVQFRSFHLSSHFWGSGPYLAASLLLPVSILLYFFLLFHLLNFVRLLHLALLLQGTFLNPAEPVCTAMVYRRHGEQIDLYNLTPIDPIYLTGLVRSTASIKAHPARDSFVLKGTALAHCIALRFTIGRQLIPFAWILFGNCRLASFSFTHLPIEICCSCCGTNKLRRQ